MQHHNKKPYRIHQLALAVAGNVLADVIAYYLVRILT